MRSNWSNESRQERGYGADYQRARKLVVARDCGLCQTCRRAGRITSFTQCDHILSKTKGGTNDASNLELICDRCHEIKSQAEQGKTRRFKSIPGKDGWPVRV